MTIGSGAATVGNSGVSMESCGSGRVFNSANTSARESLRSCRVVTTISIKINAPMVQMRMSKKANRLTDGELLIL